MLLSLMCDKCGVKVVMKNSGQFRASFPEARGAAKFHQKFHGIFHFGVWGPRLSASCLCRRVRTSCDHA